MDQVRVEIYRAWIDAGTVERREALWLKYELCEEIEQELLKYAE